MKKFVISIPLIIILLTIICLLFGGIVWWHTAKPTSVKAPFVSKLLNGAGDDLEAIVREKVKAMSAGKILFNPPKEMLVEEKVLVEVRVTKDLAVDLSTGLRGPGKPISEEIKVTPFMKVKLDGGKQFLIAPYSEEEQPLLDLPDHKFTQWEWGVTPQNSGWHSLVLSVKAVIKIPNRPDVCIDYPVLEREIYVKINPVHTTKSFIGKYWQWIIGTILIPLIGWLYNRRRKT